MSDYGGFGAIVREAQAVDEAERQRELARPDCPVCGEILKVNLQGIRNCPLGHYRK